jgi:anti-anti-sigma regulatory factor
VEITKKEWKPGVIILELQGPLQMGVECKRLELAFDELLRNKQTRVVLDLSKVTKLDSGGLGKLVNCFSR